MTAFIISLLSASLIMSVIVLLLLFFFQKKPQLLSAKSRYTIWIMVLLALVIPIRPSFGTGLVQLDSPAETELVETVNSPTNMNFPQPSDKEFEPSSVIISPTSHQIGYYVYIGGVMIWSLGTFLMFSRYMWQYYRFRQMVVRWGHNEFDVSVLNLFERILATYGVSKNTIQLKRCSLVKSPMLVGFVRPMIVLPDAPLKEETMSMVLEHEVIHYVHKDVWINLLGLIAMSLHWFNPFVKLCCSAMQEEGEAFCDATLLAGRSINYRRSYGEMILRTLSRGVAKPIALSTCFYGKKFNFKKRILSIMDTTDKLKRFSFMAISTVLSVILLSGSVFVLVQPAASATGHKASTSMIEDLPAIKSESKSVHGRSSSAEDTKKVVSQSYRNTVKPTPSRTVSDAVHAQRNTENRSVSSTTEPISSTPTQSNNTVSSVTSTTSPEIAYRYATPEVDDDEGEDDVDDYDDDDDDEDYDD
ncbi:M56 family metallopeptidase [Aerococcaceae bacterium NML191219]|nr:M56 family metallopeptidase [Aerococcaceae bacterium NML191219]